MPDDYSNARVMSLMAYQQIRQDNKVDFETALEQAMSAALHIYKAVDATRLRSDLETSINISIEPHSTLSENRDHEPWLPQKKHEIAWKFWERYRVFLLGERALAPQVVDSIDQISDEILALLEDPTRVGRLFDRRGLMVGHVQSGKTTNYTALTNKCLDAGYKLVIVLTGLHNSLRSQTQLRLDEEVLGFDSSHTSLSEKSQGRFGVSTLDGFEYLRVASLTSWEEKGDFSTAKANSLAIHPGGDPWVLVVKKNATVLRNLIHYLLHFNPNATANPQTGRLELRDLPFLLIDDEADLASVNTAEIPRDDDGQIVEDYNPTTINRLIRELLGCFTQSGYVGYTATPFANILIRHDTRNALYGDDLFPRSFILALAAPEDYIGPAQLLGQERRPGPGDSDGDPQPVFRFVDDADAITPKAHKKDYLPTDLGVGLGRAMLSYVLTCAARRARGHVNVHNSMLIHVTRFVAVQQEVHRLVSEDLTSIVRRLRYGDGAGVSIRVELRQLWERDFVPTTKLMGVAPSTWPDVDAQLLPAADLMRLRLVNGSSADILDYRQNQGLGINVIVVGGDKLSRGLTLEGLSCSYFLRSSNMYDTLMQMGRWFGYRPGYEDLCRIYTTEELFTWFQHIASASEELRQEFDYMASIGATPDEFGLRVRSHPVLMVTSRVKMREGEELQLSYQGSVSETTVFHRDGSTLDHNFSATDLFLRNCGVAEQIQSNLIWRGVPAEQVLFFLRTFRTHPDAPRADSRRLAEYIQKQNGQNPAELMEWTVALVSQAKSEGIFQTDIAGNGLSCIRRKATDLKADRFTIRRLLSPIDESLDLNDAEFGAALRATRVSPKYAEAERPTGPDMRAARPQERGLLLIYPLDPLYLIAGGPNSAFRDPPLDQVPIGIGLSFPGSSSAAKVSYVVNSVWLSEDQY